MASINTATGSTGQTGGQGNQGGGHLDGHAPKIFEGERGNSTDFLIAFKGYKLLNNSHPLMIDEAARVALALTYIDGKTVNGWKLQQLQKLEDRIMAGVTQHWRIFEKDFKDAFTYLAQKQTSYQKLKALKQGSVGLDHFLAEFCQLLGESEIPEMDREAIDLLMANMKPGIVNAIISRDDYNLDNPPTFEQFIAKAQKEHVKFIAKQAFQQPSKFGQYNNNQQCLWNTTHRGRNNQNSGGGQHLTTSQGGHHMDVDAAKLGGTLTDAKRADHMKNNLCFYCHKPGHSTKKCYTKAKNRNNNGQTQARASSWLGVTPEETQEGPGKEEQEPMTMEKLRTEIKRIRANKTKEEWVEYTNGMLDEFEDF
jgi:hypothetical protein